MSDKKFNDIWNRAQHIHSPYMPKEEDLVHLECTIPFVLSYWREYLNRLVGYLLRIPSPQHFSFRYRQNLNVCVILQHQ